MDLPVHALDSANDDGELIGEGSPALSGMRKETDILIK